MNHSSSNNHALRSYESIAAELKISATRVRQIEQRALKKLRMAFQKQGITTAKSV
jgi:DNA-directed RNA polymerase sigma subunit (sigma70/sigma32)